MQPLIWLDLCSGLGGASQPALDRGWKVIRVDSDKRFAPDICCDLTDDAQFDELAVYLSQYERIDMAWASSVCTDFTKWGLPASWACNRGGRVNPDLTLSWACRAVQARQNVDYWCFENVLASRQFLTKIFGPVRAITAGHAFWGNFPGLLPKTSGHKWKLPPSPDRAAIRAMIPYEIGETLCRAVEARR